MTSSSVQDAYVVQDIGDSHQLFDEVSAQVCSMLLYSAIPRSLFEKRVTEVHMYSMRAFSAILDNGNGQWLQSIHMLLLAQYPGGYTKSMSEVDTHTQYFHNIT